jgi:two-component system sensor histidine kinase/response regulator
MSQPFDPDELLERVDNDLDFLAETVQMLATDGPALLNEIRRTTTAADAAAVARLAHTLKGMISNFCAADAYAAAVDLERIGKSGDLAHAPPAIAAVDERLRSLTAALSEFLATRSKCAS